MDYLSISGAKSIERYRKIEADSSVEFYQEVGFLSIGPPKDLEDQLKERNILEQKDYEKVEKMEHLFWSPYCDAIFQPREAGHISPR